MPRGTALPAGQIAASDRVQLDQVYTSGTVYYSLLFRVDDLEGGSTSTTGTFVAGLSRDGGSSTSTVSDAVTRLVLRKGVNDPTKFLFGTSVNSNDGSATGPQKWDTVERDVGQTYFLIGSYTFNSGTDDDVARFWINPDASTFGTASEPAPDLTSTGKDVTQVAAFFVRQNANSPKLVTADELRVDTTWAGVTPVPEPGATGALLVLGGTLIRRARKG